MRFIVVVNYHSLIAERARGLGELSRTLTQFFGSVGAAESNAPAILLVVSRAPPRDGDGELQAAARILKRVNIDNLPDDERRVIAALCRTAIVYHPLENAHPTWATRQSILDAMRRLVPMCAEAEGRFSVVLTPEDERALRGFVAEMSEATRESLSARKYRAAAERMMCMSRLQAIESPLVTRLLFQARETASGHVSRLNHNVVGSITAGNFAAAARQLRQLEEMAKELDMVPSVGKEAAELAQESRILLAQRQSEADKLRQLEERLEDAAKREKSFIEKVSGGP